MTKAELIAAMADGAGLSKEQAKKALDAFTDSVTASLKSGNDVRLVGFGTFAAVTRKAGLARNPRTGETVHVDAKRLPFFKTGKGLRERLNGGTDHGDE